MNTNDLYLEYARVIQMCKGTELEHETGKCVRWKWKSTDKWFYIEHQGHPNFNGFTITMVDVDFAVAVLEGRPVFINDRIYAQSPNYDMLDGAIVTRTAHGNLVAQFDDGKQIKIYGFDNGLETYFTWEPPAPPTPKRTFTLNGLELPCPKPKFKQGTDWTFDISGYLFGFDTKEECDLVYQAIIKLLTEARDK